MKKILVFILALFTIFPTSVFYADEETNETTEDSASIQLTASQLSYYVVKMPLTVDATSNMTTFDVYIKGDVDEAKQIEIKEDKGTLCTDVHYLVNNANPTIKYELSIENEDAIAGSIIQEDYTDEAKIGFTIYHDNLKAGDYTCSLPVTIKIVD